MKYLGFSHFVNRSLQQNKYLLSTVTRWWSFAKELNGTCSWARHFVLGIKTNQFFLPASTTDDKLAWEEKLLSLKIVFGLDAAFFGFLEQVSANSVRGQVKRQCAVAL